MSKDLKWQMKLLEESASLDIEVPYSNDTEEERKITFEYRLTFEANTIAESKKDVLALPNISSVAHILLSVYRPKLFEPEKPSIYKFIVNQVCDGKCEKTISRQITFKEYELKQDVVLLNGKAFFVRAMKINPFVEKVNETFTDNMYYRAVYNAKKFGFNAIVAEEPSVFLTESAERFGLFVLQQKDLPRTTITYTEKAVGADEDMRFQMEQAVRLCGAYDSALNNVSCGAFCVEDYAIFDEFARPTVSASAMKAIWASENELYICRNGNKVYAFTKADSCQSFVNGHPTGAMDRVAKGIFVDELPKSFVQYAVIASAINQKDAKAFLSPTGKAAKVVFKAEISGRNIDCDSKDMVPVTAYVLDENGNIDVNYVGDAYFVPYSSAIIRGKINYTRDVGIGSDKYGNVVTIEGASEKEQEKYILPFQAGMATVLLSARNHSKFTGITVFTEFGSKTEYLNY